jgi:hypothetical protein
MAVSRRVPTPEDIHASFTRLSAAATTLNNASDELSHSVSIVEDKLQALNLGVAAWAEADRDEDEHDNYTVVLLGYTKVGNQWGVAIQRQIGNFNNPDDERQETWLFDDAPRMLRLEAIDYLPELIMSMAKTAEENAERAREKAVEVKVIASVLAPPAGKQSVPRIALKQGK